MPGGLSTEKGWRYERNSGTCRTCTRCDAYVDSIVSEPNPCPPRDGNYAYNSVGNCVLCRDNCANCNPKSTCFLSGTCVPDACTAGYMNVDNQYTAGLWQPFKVGYQRVAAVVGRRGVAGTPAYYLRCGENFATDLSKLHLRPIRDPVSIVGLLYTYDANEEIDRSDLTKDCVAEFAGECKNNTFPIWSAGGKLYCRDCPTGAISEGGRNAVCLCAEGYATLSTLQQLDIKGLVCPKYDGCNHCRADCQVFGGKSVAVMCPVGKKPYKCGEGEEATPSGCVACAPGTGSDMAGYKCEPCVPGFYGPGHTKCLPCASGTFSNTSNSSSCLPTMSMCSVGYYLLPATTQAVDGTCVLCAPCPLGTVKVVQTGHIGTCQGGVGEQNYMACYNTDELKEMAPNIRFNYTFTPDRSLSQFTQHKCEDEELPPYAKYTRIGTPVPGAQCYFACKYGVNYEVAQQYRAQVRSLATVDLKPFFDAIDENVVPIVGVKLQESKIWHNKNDAPSMDSWFAIFFFFFFCCRFPISLL